MINANALAPQVWPSQRPILFPTRFSPADLSVFRIACALARANDQELVVVHVADRRRLFNSASYREAIEDRLEAISLSQPDIYISTVVASGDPASEIVGLSAELNCSLVVMRPSSPKWFRGRFVESVSQGVKRRAHCTVLSLEKDLLTRDGEWALAGSNDYALSSAGVSDAQRLSPAVDSVVLPRG